MRLCFQYRGASVTHGMSGKRMGISEKVVLCDRLGIINRLMHDPDDENFRTLINSIAEYRLAKYRYENFVPTCEWERLDVHFKDDTKDKTF